MYQKGGVFLDLCNHRFSTALMLLTNISKCLVCGKINGFINLNLLLPSPFPISNLVSV